MTFEEFIHKYQIQLNNQQLEAVKSVDHPTLLLAVPGSGKTTVLLARLGYMIYWNRTGTYSHNYIYSGGHKGYERKICFAVWRGTGRQTGI